MSQKTDLVVELASRRDTDQTRRVEFNTAAQRLIRAAKEGKHPCFLILEGLDVGAVLPLTEPRMAVGRSNDCNIVFQDDGVSRYHAEVIRDRSGRMILRDLGSTNGTFVGGERIDEVTLQEGDKVLIGRSKVLKFVLQDRLEANYQQEIYDLSTRDGLTSLYLRKYLLQKMNIELSYAQRRGIPFTFVIFDLDNFKRVNDTFGHPAGDRVLCSVAEAVRNAIRFEDVLARWGGEEFAIMAPGTSFSGAKVLAERIRDRVFKERIAVDGAPGGFLSVTISVGTITAIAEGRLELDSSVARADENLYEAKRLGKNRVISTLMKPTLQPS